MTRIYMGTSFHLVSVLIISQTRTMTSLPIDSVLPEITDALTRDNRLVLSAPPGAGKTTKVPLHLLGADWLGAQKIIMLEPRRIAARRAAERMADLLGEKVGETIGVRSRLDTRVGPKTRIEVVTEGVFTNLITREPDLPGIGAVLFDEFHERSLDADLGLALALETQAALNDELRLVIMSATLDTGKITDRLKAPLVESLGRAFPVETHYLGRTEDRLEDQMARAIRKALAQETGSILAFLPGAAEINRTAERLEGLSENVMICPLYGALTPREQDEAIRPAPTGKRKVVLSTDIAESSLTIEGVRVVVDAGLARVPVYTTGSLGAALRTVKASIANVDQRRGRAGRTEPGTCYRLWHEEENRGLPKAPEPEILNTDLCAMILRLAHWGDAEPYALTWLDPPGKGQVIAARRALEAMKLLTAEGHLTPIGQKAVRLPLSPRLAMLVLAATNDGERALGANLAALMSENGMGGRSIDLTDRVNMFERDRSPRAKSLKSQAKNWSGVKAEPQGDEHILLARAWPDQIARVRTGDPKRYQLAGGGGARLPDNSALEGADWLVICETGGASGADPIIRLASRLDERTARSILTETSRDYAEFDEKTGHVRARRQKNLGEIVLSETPLAKPDNSAISEAICRAVADKGLCILPGYDTLANFLKRAAFAASLHEADWPALDDASLAQKQEDWLLPAIEMEGLAAIQPQGLSNAVRNWFGWSVTSEIDRLAPVHWQGPTGKQVKIDYTAEQAPLVSIRPQELYGTRIHPSICDGRVPLTLSLLSPAQRQIALTRDLPGFWTGGYIDMRKDMKGRYPKHDWPEDPANTSPPKPRPR